MYTRLMTIMILTVLCATAQASNVGGIGRERTSSIQMFGFSPLEQNLRLSFNALTYVTKCAARLLPSEYFAEGRQNAEMHNWEADPEFSGADNPGKVRYAARKRLEYVLSKNLAEGESLPDKDTLKAWVKEIWDGGLNNLGQWQGDAFKAQVLAHAARKKAEADAPVAAVLTPLRLRPEDAVGGLSATPTVETPTPAVTPFLTTPKIEDLVTLDDEERSKINKAKEDLGGIPEGARNRAINKIRQNFAERRVALEALAIVELQETLQDQARATAAALAIEAAAIDQQAEVAVEPLGVEEGAAIDHIKETLVNYGVDLAEEALAIEAQAIAEINQDFVQRRAKTREPFLQRRAALEVQIREALGIPERTAAVTRWLQMKAEVERGDLRLAIVQASMDAKDPVLQFYVLGYNRLADLLTDSQLAEDARSLFKRPFISAPEIYNPDAPAADVENAKSALLRRDQVVRSLYDRFQTDENPHVFNSTIFQSLLQNALGAVHLTPDVVGDRVRTHPWDDLLSENNIFADLTEKGKCMGKEPESLDPLAAVGAFAGAGGYEDDPAPLAPLGKALPPDDPFSK